MFEWNYKFGKNVYFLDIFLKTDFNANWTFRAEAPKEKKAVLVIPDDKGLNPLLNRELHLLELILQKKQLLYEAYTLAIAHRFSSIPPLINNDVYDVIHAFITVIIKPLWRHAENSEVLYNASEIKQKIVKVLLTINFKLKFFK